MGNKAKMFMWQETRTRERKTKREREREWGKKHNKRIEAAERMVYTLQKKLLLFINS